VKFYNLSTVTIHQLITQFTLQSSSMVQISQTIKEETLNSILQCT